MSNILGFFRSKTGGNASTAQIEPATEQSTSMHETLHTDVLHVGTLKYRCDKIQLCVHTQVQLILYSSREYIIHEILEIFQV
jgi:hypothetical protein